MNLIAKKEIPSNDPFKHVYSYQAILPLNPTERPKKATKNESIGDHKNYGIGNHKNYSQLINTNKQVISKVDNNKLQSIETRSLCSQFYPFLFSNLDLLFLAKLKDIVGYDVLDYLEKNKIGEGVISSLFNSITYTIEQNKPIHKMKKYCIKIIDSFQKGCCNRLEGLEKTGKDNDNVATIRNSQVKGF